MKITGQILKENREKKGISISEVALATKINNKTLIAIEEGNVDSLPQKTYLRGFVRAYATFLGLDVEQILNTFYEEMGSTKPKAIDDPNAAGKGETKEAAPIPASARTNINPGEQANVMKFAAIGGIIILLILIIFFKKKMDSYEREAVKPEVPATIGTISPTPTEGSPSASPTSTPTDSGLIAPVGSPRATSTPVVATATATPVPTPQPTPTATETPAPTPAATPAPTPTPPSTSKVTPKPTPTAKPSATPKPKPSPNGRAQEVIIEAMDNVDVEALIDSEPPRKMKLHADQVESIKAKHKIILKFSDGGAVNIILNGVERGVPGDLGKPYKLELP